MRYNIIIRDSAKYLPWRDFIGDVLDNKGITVYPDVRVERYSTGVFDLVYNCKDNPGDSRSIQVRGVRRN